MLAIVATFGILLGIRIGKENRDLAFLKVNPVPAVTKDYRVDEVLGFIEEKYVDSTDTKSLEELAIRYIVDSLDPHSYYLNPKEVELYDTRMQGNLVGIGVEFLHVLDTVVVTEVMENSPAQQAGLERGDQIITVNSDVIAGKQLPTARIIERLMGERRSRVRLGVLKAADGSFEDVALRRESIPVRPITLVHPIGDTIVYIAIEQFNARTSKDFLDELESYVEEGRLKHLILDLRGNPGGYLPEAVKILNQFFREKGKLLVYTEGSKSKKTEYKTAGRAYLNVDKLAVLIDEESASASEIVAGAIQDWDRGVIIGRRTFGKGLVQEQYDLGESGKLRLTVARYYTPSGRLIQKAITTNEDYSHELYLRSNSGEWVNGEDVPLPDSTIYFTEAGRKVYAGRGIVPDVFIPVDSFVLNERFFSVIKQLESLALQLYKQSFHSEELDRQLMNAMETGSTGDLSFVIERLTANLDAGATELIGEFEDEVYRRLLERYIRFRDGKSAQLRYRLKRDPFFLSAMDIIGSDNMKDLLIAQH